MNILYIHTDVINDSDVADTLQDMCCSLKELTAPFGDREKEQEHAALLVAAIEENRADAVMSLRYFPVVSLVCSVMKIKYITWVCATYDKGIYSSTLLNDCNYVFLADYALYQEFAAGDFPHLGYLPLAANAERIGRVLAEAGEPEEVADVAMLQDIFTRDASGYHPLSPDSPMKDASKGYLEGCIACQHQLSGLPSMAQYLPSYILDELKEKFPPEFESDSVETVAHYYDYRYFNSLITWADRDIHLNTIARDKYFQTVELYNSDKTYTSERIKCNDRADYRAQLPLIVRKSKINFVITHRNLKSGIPQVAWDIMAAGGFLLTNFQEDYLRLFPDCPPAMYTDERQMLSKCIYYLHHEKERRELAETMKNVVVNHHTCKCRLETVFARL